MPLSDSEGNSFAVLPCSRVISLVPSLTEAVIELGGGDRLVGRTRYCLHPSADVADLPAMGGTKDPDLDAICGAGADLVLVCREENRREDAEALMAAGQRVFVTDVTDLDDVETLLADLGELLGVASDRAIGDLRSARAEAAVRREEAVSRRAATLIWKNPWLAAGGGTYVDAMMAEAGLANVYAGEERYRATDLGDLSDRETQLVLLPDEPYSFSAEDAREIQAATGAGAFPVEGEMMTWFGTRSARSLRALLEFCRGHQDIKEKK